MSQRDDIPAREPPDSSQTARMLWPDATCEASRRYPVGRPDEVPADSGDLPAGAPDLPRQLLHRARGRVGRLHAPHRPGPRPCNAVELLLHLHAPRVRAHSLRGHARHPSGAGRAEIAAPPDEQRPPGRTASHFGSSDHVAFQREGTPAGCFPTTRSSPSPPSDRQCSAGVAADVMNAATSRCSASRLAWCAYTMWPDG
jgi:hypothetical protein